jgi:hypothetical protein
MSAKNIFSTLAYMGKEHTVAEQEFICKEPNCGKKVRYEPDSEGGVVGGVLGSAEDVRKKGQAVRIYLTCENLHTHPYVVVREGE